MQPLLAYFKVVDSYHRKYPTSNSILMLGFGCICICWQNLTLKKKLWVLIIACKWVLKVKFDFDVSVDSRHCLTHTLKSNLTLGTFSDKSSRRILTIVYRIRSMSKRIWGEGRLKLRRKDWNPLSKKKLKERNQKFKKSTRARTNKKISKGTEFFSCFGLKKKESGSWSRKKTGDLWLQIKKTVCVEYREC